MALIKCPGCGEEISDQSSKCVHCGYVLKETKKRFCRECGAEIEEGRNFCGKCGCPAETEDPEAENVTAVTVENEKIAETGIPSAAVTETSVPVKVLPAPEQKETKPAKKKSKKTIVIAIAAIAVLLCGGIAYRNAKQKAAEEAAAAAAAEAQRQAEIAAQQAKEQYQSDLQTVTYLMLKGAADAESCGNLIVNVWHDSIFEDEDEDTVKYTKDANGVFYDDFNDALTALFTDADYLSTISEIKNNQSSVESYMKSMTNPPSEFTDAYAELKNMYSSYAAFVGLILDPEGSYNTFSSNFGDADSALMSAYNTMKLYIE